MTLTHKLSHLKSLPPNNNVTVHDKVIYNNKKSGLKFFIASFKAATDPKFFLEPFASGRHDRSMSRDRDFVVVVVPADNEVDVAKLTGLKKLAEVVAKRTSASKEV